MYFEVSQRFYFDAAHTLQREVEAEGSRRIHGHTYEAEVSIKGTPGPDGMVVDLGFLRQEIAKVRDRLDHHFLDEVEDLGHPTLENLCLFIFKALKDTQVSSVSVWREGVGDKCVMRL